MMHHNIQLTSKKSVLDELKILEQIRAFVALEDQIPPLLLPELYTLADKFLALEALDSALRDWVVVMINNCLWEETVSAIPYDKRVLILPECLKNSTKCQAENDEFGLLCEACGQCDMGEVLDEAEELGMVTLVAEGSTMVAELIDNGDVEAIIGVSCLEALEKAFPNMIHNAIPGLAIPLSTAGCVDTKVNVELLRRAINLPYNPGSRKKSVIELKNDVKSWFSFEEGSSLVESIGYDYLGGEGKRWRPFLTAAVYNAVADEQEIPDDVKKLAVAVECFHKASLIHDDIEDNDDQRYGKSTLHKEIGIGPAINIGDFLIGEGYKILTETAFEASKKVELFTCASNGHRALTIGQGMELAWMQSPRKISSEEVFDIFRLKTAPAFEVALGFGAIAAEIFYEYNPDLKKFSEFLGLAYQIRDDIEDFDVTAPVSAPSIILALLCEKYEGLSFEEICHRLKAGEFDKDCEEVKDEAQKLYEKFRENAFFALKNIRHRDLKMLLFRVAARIL